MLVNTDLWTPKTLKSQYDIEQNKNNSLSSYSEADFK